ncbi:MAG: Holliday junction resolvase RuvX [Planctomycetes bacterium]|nr:Holliday junction resolvase RuvX [Planctomycetota bacterium]
MGSVLGVDYGTKRIGIAVTDPGRTFVFGRETLERQGAIDAARVAAVAKEEGAELVALGLPFNANGSEGPMAAAARAFGAAVGAAAGLPVVFVDERYTSIEADERLKERYPKDTRKRRSLRDRAAAILILRTFLEHGPVR